MEAIVKMFGAGAIGMICFILIMGVVFKTADNTGHTGIMEIAGSGMADWQEDSRDGFTAYRAESAETFPEITETVTEALTTGTYRLSDLFTGKDHDGNVAELALLTMTFPDGTKEQTAHDVAEITFPVKGIYSLELELRDTDQRITKRTVNLPVNEE